MEMRQRIWDNLLDAGRMSRYYDRTSDVNQWWHLGLSGMTIMGSIAAATVLLLEWTEASALFFFLVAAITVLMLVFDFSRRSQIARTVGAQLREIEVELRRIWYRDTIEGVVIEGLEERINNVVQDDLAVSHRRNEQCNEEAYRALESFIGPEPRRQERSASATAKA